MGIFDGVLLCSDVDGTLTCEGRMLPENAEAIRYFQSEGGLFTLSTGRNCDFANKSNFGIRCNTYIICVNGTVICDEDGKNIVYSKCIDGNTAERLIDFATTNFELDNLYIMNAAEQYNYTERKIGNPCNKMVCVAKDESEALRFMSAAEKEFGDYVELYRSWNVGVEIIPCGSGKGECVRILKELTGSKLLICAGDYENDIKMLKQADIGYAVGNAIPEVKRIADRITVPNSQAAIREIIRITEAELRENENKLRNEQQ